MFLVFLIISICVFVLSILLSIYFRKSSKKSLSIMLVGVILATGFLVYPLFKIEGRIAGTLKTIIYSLEMTKMNDDFDILQNAPENLWIIYKIFLYIYTILAPILTASVILAFLENFIYELKSRMLTKKTVHIFSEVNEKSLTLAESIKTKKNYIIFCDKESPKEYKERIKAINAILLKKSIKNMSFKGYKGKIKIYEISENDDKNLNRTLDLIEAKVGNKKDIEVYVFSLMEEAQIILDSIENKNNLKITIINEAQQMVYRVLDELPLYTNAKNNIISAVVVGAGHIGLEFVKAILWCGQILDYKLQITVIDKNANEIKSRFEAKCPEITNANYDIYFYESDINSINSYNTLSQRCSKANYVVITMGDDNLNLNTAIYLRRVFLQIGREPVINLQIKNEIKRKQITKLKSEPKVDEEGNLKEESVNLFDLKPFGSIEEMYRNKNILNEKIENIAKEVHLAYKDGSRDLKDYYATEYSKRSSRATALHIKYKLHSILGDDLNNIDKLRVLLLDKEVLDLLARNEHDRWNAYMRTEGYKYAGVTDVEKYYPKIEDHKNRLAKLHPSIVAYDELDRVSENVTRIIRKTKKLDKPKDFKKSDEDIVKKIPDILILAKEREDKDI